MRCSVSDYLEDIAEPAPGIDEQVLQLVRILRRGDPSSPAGMLQSIPDSGFEGDGGGSSDPALAAALQHAATIEQHDDVALMRRAIAQARRRTPAETAPNPIVGCVIVDRTGRVVGEGFHPKAGEPHAEIFALRDAGCIVEQGPERWAISRADAVRGGTAYVTLEPCSHVGRTPPCCHALKDAGVARVVVGMGDPAPWVSGKGIAVLREAGIQAPPSNHPIMILLGVDTGIEGPICESLNPDFIARMREEGERRSRGGAGRAPAGA